MITPAYMHEKPNNIKCASHLHEGRRAEERVRHTDKSWWAKRHPSPAPSGESLNTRRRVSQLDLGRCHYEAALFLRRGHWTCTDGWTLFNHRPEHIFITEISVTGRWRVDESIRRGRALKVWVFVLNVINEKKHASTKEKKWKKELIFGKWNSIFFHL